MSKIFCNDLFKPTYKKHLCYSRITEQHFTIVTFLDPPAAQKAVITPKKPVSFLMVVPHNYLTSYASCTVMNGHVRLGIENRKADGVQNRSQ
jgi:hypothetical protein